MRRETRQQIVGLRNTVARLQSQLTTANENITKLLATIKTWKSWDKIKSQEISSTNEENERLREALEKDQIDFEIIVEHHTLPQRQRGNTLKRCRHALDRIEQALKGE